MPLESTRGALIRWLKAMGRKKRLHANYFQAPRKETEEIGVASDFFVQREKQFAFQYPDEVRLGQNPPDIEYVAENGVIGLELTELVNEAAIKSQIENSEDYVTHVLDWDVDIFAERLNDRIDTKNEKCGSIRGSYAEMHLLIYTDENQLAPRDIERLLPSIDIAPAENLDKIYLMTSPCQKVKRVGLYQLK